MDDRKFSELLVGDKCEKSIRITAEMVGKFLDLSGDTNPLHTNADYAKSNGFNGCVVYGALSACTLSGIIGVNLPGKYGLLVRMQLNFKKPVYVNDELLYTLTITSKNFGNLVVLELIVTRDDEICTTGEVITRILK